MGIAALAPLEPFRARGLSRLAERGSGLAPVYVTHSSEHPAKQAGLDCLARRRERKLGNAKLASDHRPLLAEPRNVAGSGRIEQRKPLGSLLAPDPALEVPNGREHR